MHSYSQLADRMWAMFFLQTNEANKPNSHALRRSNSNLHGIHQKLFLSSTLFILM